MQLHHFFAIAAIFVLTGCASSTYQPIDKNWIPPGAEIAVLHVPPEEFVYVQFSRDAGRYADFEVSEGAELLAGVAGGAIGTWAGTAGALAMLGANPGNWVAAVNPAAAGIVLGLPIARSGLTAIRKGRAREMAARFQTLERSSLPTLEPSIASAFRQQRSLGKVTVSAATDRTFAEFRNAEEFLEGISQEYVLVVGSLSAFSPGFEILETTLYYGIARKVSEEAVDVLYSNRVSSQSSLRSVLDGDRPQDDWANLHEHNKHADIARIRDQAWFSRLAHSKQQTKLAGYARKHEKRKSKTPEDYDVIDKRDPSGEIWHKNDAEIFRTELELNYLEASRLMVADLLTTDQADMQLTQAPGLNRNVWYLPEFSTNTREAYRLESGEVVSISKHSRMIP